MIHFLFLQILNTLCTIMVQQFMHKPYMDEEFHYDQQMHYLNNDFTYWNGKLTTPPALYILNYSLLQIASYFNYDLLQATRMINTFIYQNISYYLLSRMMNKTKALTFCLIPTIYFYNFLFYTDQLSICLIISTYYCITYDYYKSSAITSILAILTRQTNIVWVVFICLNKFIQQNSHKLSHKDPRLSIVFQIQTLINIIIINLSSLLFQFKYQIGVVVGFIALAISNGGIVLGDKSNHQLSFHLVQMFYFIAFVIIILPLSIGRYTQLIGLTLSRIKQSRNARTTFLLLSLFAVFIIHYTTIVHPFMVSDNRHFIFYLYRYFLSRNIIRYSMSIVYAIATIMLTRLIIIKKEQIISIGLLFIFIGLAIIPASLIEFRYYSIGLLFLYFEIPEQSVQKIIIFAILNLALVYILTFEFKCPFEECRWMF